MLYPTCADRLVESNKVFERGFCYGIYGNPTHHALEDVVAEIEGGTRCQIVSSGLAAVTTPLLAYLGAGDHCPRAGQHLRPLPATSAPACSHAWVWPPPSTTRR